MLRYSMDLSDEKKEAAINIALESEGNVRKRKITTPILYFLGVLELLIGVYFCVKDSYVTGILLLFIGMLMFILGLKAKTFQRYTLKKAEKLLDDAFRTGTVEYVFDEEGVEIVSQMGYTKNPWNAFKGFGTMGQYVFVKRKDNKMILVDKNDLSEAETKELKRLLSQNLHP